ncbi:MAG: hypothetical protein HYX54_08470 [Chloroflexi bacterium]|nr:hypothetical protein [Chloroflexota bacterium]
MDIAEAAGLALAEAGHITDLQTDLPRLARDPKFTAVVERVLGEVSTAHRLLLGDARDLSAIPVARTMVATP